MNPLQPLGKPLAMPVNNATGQIWPRQLTTQDAPMSLDEEMKKKREALLASQSRKNPLQPLTAPR